MEVKDASSGVIKQIAYQGMQMIYIREKNGNTINHWYKFVGTDTGA